MILSTHTMLSILIIRHFADLGRTLFAIVADPVNVPGTRASATVILPSPSLLLRVRRLFRNGETVAAMIDRGDPEPRNAIYPTAAGPMRISDALVRLALRENARVLFLATRMNPASEVVMRLAAPSPGSASVPEILADFVRFIDEARSLAVSESRAA